MFSQILFVGILAVFGESKNLYTLNKFPHHGRIVGGHDANIVDFPHQISLQYAGSHECGGSIISENYIVTAGHCTEGTEARVLSIRANSSIIESGGVVIKVEKIFHHPLYDSQTIDYDISILKLAEPLKLGSGIKPINLPQEDEDIPENTPVQVSGWGIIEEYSSDLSAQLQAVEISIVDRKACKNAYPEVPVTERMICAGVPNGGKDSCQGDSGGPLISNNTLYGIVSWGYGCAEKGYPGVYGNVAALRKFIRQLTGI